MQADYRLPVDARAWYKVSVQWDLIILLACGLVAGFMNVLAGGGSLITLSAMVFMGFPGAVANGTNRVAIAVQNVSAVGGFARQGYSDLRQSLCFAACALPGAVAGALTGVRLSGPWFNRVLAAVIIGVMILMAWKPRKAAATGQTLSRRRKALVYIAMVGIGFYGGFIQAGVGFLVMAALHRGWCMDLVRVNMHKVFIILVYTIPSLAVFALHGDVRWLPGLELAVGNAVGAWVGSHVAVKKGDPVIKIVLYIALVGMAVKLLWSG